MNDETKKLVKTVQHNCHIADARHAGDYTLCVYLLKMREMYRWEQGIDFKTQLTTDDVGDWLTEREGVWDEVEAQDYKPLIIEDTSYEPFQNELINQLIDNNNLVYNAGLGIRCRPHFFLGELEEKIEYDDFTIYISGREYARDMAAPAAMAQENRVFIRRESLRRVIWEILDDARVSGLDNPLTRAMQFYNFDTDIEKALDAMTNAEIDYVIQHEIGEVKAGKILGEKWNQVLASFTRTQAEIMLRAVRDHLADAMTTLPLLLEKAESASIHFYFGNMTAMRKHLAPGYIRAYESWCNNGDLSELKRVADKAQTFWQTLAQDVLNVCNEEKNHLAIEKMISQRVL